MGNAFFVLFLSDLCKRNWWLLHCLWETRTFPRMMIWFCGYVGREPPLIYIGDIQDQGIYLKSLIWFWESPLAVPLQYVVPIWQRRHHSQLNWTVVQFQELHNTAILTNQSLCFGWQTHTLKNWWTLWMQLRHQHHYTKSQGKWSFSSVSSQWQQGTSDPHAVQGTRLCCCRHQSWQ